MSTSRIPPELCYWDLLTSDQIKGGPEAAIYAAEPRLPVPAEQLAWSISKAQGSYVLCAIEHDRFVAWLKEHKVVSWQVTPDGVPAWLGEEGVDERAVQSLNLRYGQHEHPSRKRARLLSIVFPAMIMVAITVFLALGLYQRAAAEQNNAARLTLTADALIRQHAQPVEGVPLPARERLIQELRRLRLASGGGQGEDAAGWSASLLMNSLLAAWPKRERVFVSGLNVDADGMTLRCLVPDPETAQRLHAAVGNLLGPLGRRWVCPAVDLSPLGGDQQLTLVWRPRPIEGP